MRDCIGTDVEVGDRVVVRREHRWGGKVSSTPLVGTVRRISTYPGHPRTLAILADDSPGDHLDAENHTWSSWLKSHEFMVVPPTVEAKGSAAKQAGEEK